MKKMTKLLAWMLLTALPAGAAYAETVDRAALPIDLAKYERYPSYACDAAGKWQLRANEADALLDRFETYIKNNGGELCVFYLEARGDAVTGLWTPVLCLRYDGRETIDAAAVSILVGDVRYDFAAQSVKDDRPGELICAPLTTSGLEALRSVSRAKEIQVRLHGEESYTAVVDLETTNARRRVEAAALNGLSAGVMLMDQLGAETYDLWDLSAAAWEDQYGFAPQFSLNVVSKMLGGETLTDDFGMVQYGDSNRAAKAAQQVLADAGFLSSGSISTTFGKMSQSAALRAQQYLGMIRTGCMDAQLEKALAADAGLEEKSSEPAWTPLGDAAQVAVERYWLADGVGAVNAPESVQSVYNTDNVLLIADGFIKNISGAELKLFSQVEGRLINGSYTYPATVLCETNGGTALDMTLLPMAQARLIVYAEVPPALAAQDGWALTLAAGEASVEYALK